MPALEDVSLELAPGAFVALVGPSGCGKSTLLRIAAGLETPEVGEVLVDGAPVSGPGHAGFMPQQHALLPWRRVLDNLALGPELAGASRADARERARAWLADFGLEGFERAWPRELSGGMRQRAALLRTVLVGRDLLLLDEPFGALDALTRLELQDWLLAMRRRFGWSVLLVTHDADEATYLADRAVVLGPRPGRIVAEVDVPLPRPRRREMIGDPRYGATVTRLLAALGVVRGR